MDKLTLIKIGGGLLEDRERLESILDLFCEVPGKKMMVHGGGAQANRIARDLGLEPVMHKGRRITNRLMLDVVTMVYAGLNAKQLVAMMQKRNCNALSLSGADGNLLSATKRPAGEVDFGLVGDITPKSVRTDLLKLLLHEEIVPVINAITHDGNGGLLNTNADTIATTIASALAEHFVVDLLFLTDQPGVLGTPGEPVSLFTSLHPDKINELVESGIIGGGMMPKIENSLAALKGGVKSVRIGDEQILTSDSAGTFITLKGEEEET